MQRLGLSGFQSEDRKLRVLLETAFAARMSTLTSDRGSALRAFAIGAAKLILVQYRTRAKRMCELPPDFTQCPMRCQFPRPRLRLFFRSHPLVTQFPVSDKRSSRVELHVS